MLILARKKQESVVVGGTSGAEQMLKVTVIDISGSTVRLGFEADKSVAVHRHEVWERIRAENQALPPHEAALRPNGRATAIQESRHIDHETI
jgi:carbon storage regulator